MIKPTCRSLTIALLLAASPAPLLAAPPAAPATQDAAIARLPALQQAFEAAFAKRDWDAAAEALAATLAIQESAFGAETELSLTTLDTLAIAYQLAGRAAEAETAFRRELGIRKRTEGVESSKLPRLLTSIAFNVEAQNRLDEGEKLRGEGLALQRKIAPGSPETADALLTHAASLIHIGRSGDAMPEAEQGRELFARLNGADSLEAARGHDSVGRALGALGRYGEAEAQHRRALAIRSQASGASEAELSSSRNSLAIALTQQGRFKDAEALLREALTARRKSSNTSDGLTADLIANLATVVQNGGDPAAAEPLHREALALHTALSGPDSPSTLTATTNLATDLSELGRYREAEVLARQAFTGRLALHGENHPETAIAATNLAAQLSELGRDVEADLLYRRALAVMQAVNGETHPDTASAYANLAFSASEQGRYGEAADLHRKALAIRRAALGPTHPDVAVNIGNLAYTLAQQGDYTAADPLYREALTLLRKAYGERSLGAARAYNNLAANLDSLDRVKEATPLYAKAYEIRKALLGTDHPLTLISLNNVAYGENRSGKRKTALAKYRSVVASERAVHGPGNPIRVPALGNLAMVLSETPVGDGEALALAREAAGIAAGRRSTILSGTAGGADAASQALLRARSVQTLRSDPFTTAFIALMQVDWRAGEHDSAAVPALRAEAFAAAQELDVPAAALAMARTAARAAAGGGELGGLVARQQVLSEQAATLDKSYADALAQQDRAAAAKASAQINTVGADLAQVDVELARRFPQYTALIAPTAVSLADVQKRLGPGEGLLLIVPSSGDMFSFAVGPTSTAWHRAPGRQDSVRQDVTRLLCQVDPATCTSTDRGGTTSPYQKLGYAAFDRAAAFGLYRDLIAPVEPALAGVKTLYVTTVGSLATLPLAVLATAPPLAGDDADPIELAKTPWLGDRYALTVLPSVANLRAATRVVRASGTGFVGYGAPVLTGVAGTQRGAVTSYQEGLADQALLQALPPLPGTQNELKAMAKALGSPANALRLGMRGTERALKADRALPRARVIAFATHGLLPRELGEFAEPGLVFTPPATPSALDDGVLSASEAAELKLTADWVILSACNTAGAESGAESLSGLARAFLYAGAGSLLASNWRVSDEATAVLTVEALEADKTLTRAQALQAAARAVREGKRSDGSAIAGWDDSWVHPAAWGPFSLIANRDE